VSGLYLWADYTDWATVACWRSDCQLLLPYSRFSRQEPLLFYQVAPQLNSRGWVDPVPDPLLFFLVVPGIEPGPPDLLPRSLTTRPQRRSHPVDKKAKRFCDSLQLWTERALCGAFMESAATIVCRSTMFWNMQTIILILWGQLNHVLKHADNNIDIVRPTH
jgi:hypothetical protein